MLVLTRPSPKPITPPIQPPPDRSSIKPDSIEPDSISLRPLGRTGPPPSLLTSNITTGSVSPKINNNNNNKFVPPHLRPSFHGKEEKPEQLEVKKQTGFGTQFRQTPRPKSGGGYERDSMNHWPGSSGANQPVSSG
ncbi:uncharacterized protein LOC143534723 [Bidens hawaiensis]|uniref:uncharacterized protein LOC143534723 n=1 Tax=Bidens hawaiensis TaxID=980011 RepID=UPI0040495B5E